MVAKADAIYHLSLLFLLSMILLPLKRRSLAVLLLVIPGLIEIVQFFVPGRVPDFIDAFHGYLGILLAYCLIQMWGEIWPAVKKFRLHFKSKKFQNQGNMR
jgi:VanZ family protein